jgi:hypothetical protein
MSLDYKGEQLFIVTIEKQNNTGRGFGVGTYTVTINELIQYVRDYPNAKVIEFNAEVKLFKKC